MPSASMRRKVRVPAAPAMAASTGMTRPAGCSAAFWASILKLMTSGSKAMTRLPAKRAAANTLKEPILAPISTISAPVGTGSGMPVR